MRACDFFRQDTVCVPATYFRPRGTCVMLVSVDSRCPSAIMLKAKERRCKHSMIHSSSTVARFPFRPSANNHSTRWDLFASTDRTRMDRSVSTPLLIHVRCNTPDVAKLQDPPFLMLSAREAHDGLRTCPQGQVEKTPRRVLLASHSRDHPKDPPLCMDFYIKGSQRRSWPTHCDRF